MRLFIKCIYTFYILASTSCVSSQLKNSNKNTQVIEYVVQNYPIHGEEFSKPIMTFKDKVWYKDSMAIESVSSLNIASGSKNNSTQSMEVLYYRFSNLRNGSVYEYKNFSDTAKLLREYSYNDTVQVIGGWNFKYLRKWNYNEPPETLQDTLINKIKYKRIGFSWQTQEPRIAYVAICYFRCDKIGTIFNLDPFLSKTVGCPLVKMHSFPTSMKTGLHFTQEIIFLANSFTPKERTVFNKWEKYALSHPVDK
ncbi:MAG TPA: hypothetical protein VHD35_12085 [Chitinophagaceae bacterium]|nr:hypothetical protein [Chitinophagaceae bacterium]